MYTKSISSLFILLLTVTFGFTQDKKEQKAEKEIENYAYNEAIETYKYLIKKGYSDAGIFRNLGDANYANAQYEEAVSWYSRFFRSKDAKTDTEAMYKYAQSLKSNGEYTAADVWIKKMEQINAGDARVKKYNNQKDYLQKIKNISGRYTLKNLALNSSESDFAPSFYGENLVFATARDTGMVLKKVNKWTNKPFADLYFVKPRLRGKFSVPEKLSEILNEKTHETTTAFSKDGKTIYFTRNNSKKGKFLRDENGVSRLKIYRAVLENNEWSKVTELPFNSDDYSVAHPALSSDGTKLFFASDMKGSLGKSDLFVVDILPEGRFGAPTNLGPKINTEARETFPFISTGNVLYFSSDGHPGIGGLDIFAADLTDIENFQVKNVGKPINSLEDDFTFIIDDISKKGYFASNRRGGRGGDDIYSFIENKTVDYNCRDVRITGTIKNEKTNEPVSNALVVVFDEQSNIIAETFSGYEGKFTLEGPCENGNYNLVASKGDLGRGELPLYDIANENTDDVEVILLTNLEKPALGVDMISYLGLEPILFETDKASLRPMDLETLEKVIEFMQWYPDLRIQVESHTDAIGGKGYNLRLSKRRAKTTVEYLLSKGISSSRISGEGFGERQLVNDCKTVKSCTDARHSENRRSEFIVVE